MTSFLHSSCPLWFQSPISQFLSLLPLRTDGVRQTINFIAGTTPIESQQDEQSLSPSRPSLSLDSLKQVSKVIASVPSSMTAEKYFSAIAPQLLQLLDDSDNDNKRVASYIIGWGILSRRKIGSPGSPGWKLFAQPILDGLRATARDKDQSNDLSQSPKSTLEGMTGSAPSVEQSLNRLYSLVLLHPNPGLMKRLVSPVSLCLWALYNFVKESLKPVQAEQAWAILVSYFKIAAGPEQLVSIGEHLLAQGGPGWRYARTIEGEIQAQEDASELDSDIKLAAMVHKTDERVNQFLGLIRSIFLDNQQISNIFGHFCTEWLRVSGPKTHEIATINDNSRSPLRPLVIAKITLKMIEDFKDLLAANSEGILKLANQLIASFNLGFPKEMDGSRKKSDPSMVSLANIVAEDSNSYMGEEEPDEPLSLVLSLLSALLSSPDFAPETVPKDLTNDLRRNIIRTKNAKVKIPTTVNLAASNVLSILDYQQYCSSSSSHDARSAFEPQYNLDRNTHRTALEYLADEATPVRAQGLSLLASLVSKASPILDIPSSIVLLTSLLQDEDEYIYLPSMQTIALLASRHPKSVIRMLTEQYADTDEKSILDLRLKIGQALMQAIEQSGSVWTNETSIYLGQTLIAIASRRGDRQKEMRDRQRHKADEERSQKRARRVFGGALSISEETDITEKIDENVTKIFQGWQDTGHEEDVRIRASALSVLGKVIECNTQSLGSTIVSDAVDCTLAILKLEVTPEKSIIRRAAARVLNSVVKALDVAEEQGQRLGFGFAGENLTDIISVLRYVEFTDRDEMVVDYLRTLIENLETWQQKSIFGLYKSNEDLEPRLGLEDRILEGLAIDPERQRKPRPKIEEIDE